MDAAMEVKDRKTFFCFLHFDHFLNILSWKFSLHLRQVNLSETSVLKFFGVSASVKELELK